MASTLKLRDPSTFMLSIEAFELLPESVIPYLAYFLPWLELGLGILLITGLWSRAAGLLSVGVYSTFTIGLMSVILRDMSVDCGCFGKFFGSGPIGWNTIARNSLFIVASLAVLIRGGGMFSLDRFLGGPGEAATCEVNSRTESAVEEQAT